jgi:hypothetical protein
MRSKFLVTALALLALPVIAQAQELSAAHKEGPNKADVPLGLSELLWEALSAPPSVLLAEY